MDRSIDRSMWVDITKPERIMSHGRVFHLGIVQKAANFKTQTSKFYDETLAYTLPLTDKTSAR